MKLPSPRLAASGACLLAILLTSACASGRQPPRANETRPERQTSVQGGKIARPIALLFAGMDVDQDHVIDEGELANGISHDWRRFGGNTVSALGLAEWSVSALGDADALPNHIAFDRNFDGKVTEDEFRARLTSEFAQLDKDHDRQLTRAELLVDAPARSQSHAMPNGEQGGERSRGGGRPPR